MCVACREFIKQKLTFQEFKSALWETTREDETHLEELERLLYETRENPDRVRQALSQGAGQPQTD